MRTQAETVVLDLGGMNRIREIDSHNLIASFDAGVRGSDAEAALRKLGLTCGHYPQSIGISTVGGWVATRSAWARRRRSTARVRCWWRSTENCLSARECEYSRHCRRRRMAPRACSICLRSQLLLL